MDPRPDYGRGTYEGSNRLQDKVAIITGADSGIGRAVALAFAREGADVVLSYLEEEESDARETVQAVEEAGRKAISVPGDIREKENCQKIVAQAVDKLGRVDVLVNNAAYQMFRNGITEISDEEFDRVFKTNIYAMFYLCRAAVPHMREGSAIINVSSIEAFQPKPSLLDYATTKSAIVAFSQGLALETTPNGIRVNVVAPGPVWAPLIPATLPKESVTSFGGNSPLGRPAQPAEVASAFVYLASEESSSVSGAVLEVTGGKLP
jgi:NAD(P)-dependent dehydrogenase (short-subunit alcohol dehydrogenase family)